MELMTKKGVSAAGLTVLFIVFLVAFWFRQTQTADLVFASQAVTDLNAEDLFEHSFIETQGVKAAHAAFITENPEGELIAFWFGGSKEGRRDVQIYRSKLVDGVVAESAQAVLSPQQLSQLSGRFIKNLGNPVAWYQGEQLMLAVVNVSVGGWATARVDLLSSGNDGLNFDYRHSLRTSPFFNISTLARTRPLVARNGLLFPAYFELERLNPLLVELDADLNLNTSYTLPVRAIQSALVEQQGRVRLFSRPMGQDAIQVADVDVAQRRLMPGTASELGFENASSAVSVVQLDEQRLLMAHNPGGSRKRLALSQSDDFGETWTLLYEFPNENSASLAYPSLLLGADGYLHLVFSESKRDIHYVRFSLTGLVSQAGGQQ